MLLDTLVKMDHNLFADLRTVESHLGDKPYPSLLGFHLNFRKGVMSETSLQPNSESLTG